jgi:hypothetical protein
MGEVVKNLAIPFAAVVSAFLHFLSFLALMVCDVYLNAPAAVEGLQTTQFTHIRF